MDNPLNKLRQKFWNAFSNVELSFRSVKLILVIRRYLSWCPSNGSFGCVGGLHPFTTGLFSTDSYLIFFNYSSFKQYYVFIRGNCNLHCRF